MKKKSIQKRAMFVFFLSSIKSKNRPVFRLLKNLNKVGLISGYRRIQPTSFCKENEMNLPKVQHGNVSYIGYGHILNHTKGLLGRKWNRKIQNS